MLNSDSLLCFVGTKLLPVLCELVELFSLQSSGFVGVYLSTHGSVLSNRLEWTPLQTSAVLSLASALQFLTSQLRAPSELGSGLPSLNCCLKREFGQKAGVIIGLPAFVSLLSPGCLLRKSNCCLI